MVACEIAPPLSVSTNKLSSNIELVKPYVTAINFTDNASATPRMSSWACSKIAIEHGAEPVMQIAARDRTRVGLQAEILGATALGIRNVLCVTGDSPVLAPAPRGRMDINDLDSIQMLWILRRMRDEGHYLDGREIKFPPKFFLGAAASPFASEPKFQAIREHKKVNAGAQFFQTNLVYDVERMEIWLNELAKRNILDKVYILVGITPLKSFKMAHYMTRSARRVCAGGDPEAHGSGRCGRECRRKRACRSPWNWSQQDQGLRKAGRPRPAHHGGGLGRDRAAHRDRGGPAAGVVSPHPSTGQQ